MVIFGSGKIGGKALKSLGNSNVKCFCDNNQELAGTEKHGKPVISFDELKARHADDIIVIAVGYMDSFSIAKQCEENGITDYVSYKLVSEMFPHLDGEQMTEYIKNIENRIFLKKQLQVKKVYELEESVKRLTRQVEYFKDHVDIRSMKPAFGRLREWQLDCVRAAAGFFSHIEDAAVKPILYGGSLLGYVRNNGFIPWDDDMDFVLIREDYEKLKEYCRRNINENGFKDGENTVDGLDNYYWFDRYHFFGVIARLPDGRTVGMDFFSMDYYAEDYDFDALKKYAAEYTEELFSLGQSPKDVNIQGGPGTKTNIIQ